MLVYLVRRINLLLITLLILSFVGFNLARLEPNSHWLQIEFWAGWYQYAQGLLQLDFGITSDGNPVVEELKLVFPATLELCFIAFLFSIVIGIPLGTIAGMRQGKALDTVISFVSVTGFSAPIFWIALLMIMLFSLNWEVLPVSGRYDLLYEIPYVTGFALIDAFLMDDPKKPYVIHSVWQHLLLPCMVLALTPTTQVVGMMRTSVSEVMATNYIRAARIKGLSTYKIVVQHVLRNAFPPIIPKIGAQLSTMLTLAIVLEAIFDWPGIGRWLLDALFEQDYVSIQAGVIVVSALVMMANVLAEFISAFMNPLARKEWDANQ